MSEVFQLFECGDVFQFTDPADSYQTWQGLRGPKGDPGEPGPPGQGLTISGTVAAVADLPASAEQGTVYNVGAEAPYELYMYEVGTGWISLGYLEGPEGPAGAAAGFGTPTISVGSGTGTPSATVTASGPDTAKVFSFQFDNLKGAQGDPGAAGQDGQDGADGAAATIAVGTVSGLPAGSTPTVTNSGTSAAAVFNFGIPAGAQGAPGQDGDDGAAAGFGTPTASVDGNVGTPGVTITASGPDTAKVFDFAFTNLKGATGATGQGVPAGGSAGQVLTKTSGTDYDTEWVDPPDPSGYVSYAEAQTLTAAEQAQARENIGADWVLLWQNASPTSSFSGQNIPISTMTSFQFLYVSATSFTIIVPVIQNASTPFALMRIATWLSGGEIYSRGLTTRLDDGNNYLQFGNCLVTNVVTNSSSEQNSYLIPLKIYGIK